MRSVRRGVSLRSVVQTSAIPAGVSSLAAFIGDSWTAQDNAPPMYWQLGLQGAPLNVVANSGFNGRTTIGLSANIDNSYLIDTEPGLGGVVEKYGTLGWIFTRLGSPNDYKGGVGSAGAPIDDANKGFVDSIVTQLLAKCEHLVVLACGNVSDGSNTRKTGHQSWNAYAQAKAAANPTRVHFIDDCAALTDVNGDIIPAYYLPDRQHPSDAGKVVMATSTTTAFADLFVNQGYASPLVTSAAHVYPTFPQWAPNPTNTGTNGSFGSGWSGQCPTGMTIGGNGGGTSGTVAIVAADGGDPNQTPWVVITPSSSQIGSTISISFAGAGRTVDTNNPETLDQLIEVKLTALKNYSSMDAWMQCSNRITRFQHFGWSPTSVVTATATHRQNLYRLISGATGATSCYIYLGAEITASGAMGSFAFRNFTVEG